MYNQQEIVLIPFPYSDLTGNKKRPALIISNSILDKTEDRICCLVTSNIHKDDIEIKNTDFKEGNLPFKSSVKSHRIFTINQKIIIKKLGIVTESFHNKITNKISEYIKKDN